MSREKPKNANFYGWRDFEKYADENGFGDDFTDWEAWWECWKAGFIAAMNDK